VTVGVGGGVAVVAVSNLCGLTWPAGIERKHL